MAWRFRTQSLGRPAEKLVRGLSNYGHDIGILLACLNPKLLSLLLGCPLAAGCKKNMFSHICTVQVYGGPIKSLHHLRLQPLVPQTTSQAQVYGDGPQFLPLLQLQAQPRPSSRLNSNPGWFKERK